MYSLADSLSSSWRPWPANRLRSRASCSSMICLISDRRTGSVNRIVPFPGNVFLGGLAQFELEAVAGQSLAEQGQLQLDDLLDFRSEDGLRKPDRTLPGQCIPWRTRSVRAGGRGRPIACGAGPVAAR